uniref:WD repeat domain phosphoinositide-interacting protein 2 n=1 Tax=Wuchereria bancrofti TaxID=6293 RepID=A0AAF5PSP3_WUCBA
MADLVPGTSSDDTFSQDDTDPELIFLDFSRSLDRLATCGDYGFIVYKTRDDETPHIIYEMCRRPMQKRYLTFVNDVVLVECFSPIHKFAVVLGKHPHALHFYDASMSVSTGTSHFPERILSVRSCSTVIAVGLENEIQCFCIYMDNYENLETYIRVVKLPSPTSFSLLMDLTGEERPHLAYPDSNTTGLVAVHDICAWTHSKKLINAHNHPIAALRFNDDATLLATASNIATVIRVYAVRKQECLFVFRRGLARTVTVNSMAFSADSRFLCLTSNTETIHVFKLEGTLPKFLQLEDELLQKSLEESKPPQPVGWYDYLAGPTRAAAEYLAPARDFASATLPEIGNVNIACLKKINGKLHILAAISSRKFFAFLVNEEEGGPATLVNSGKLISKVTL